MKAKVILTGEVVDVVPVYDCWQHIEGFKEMKSDNARYFDTSEINILCTSKKIDWEQRRFELVKELSTIVFNCPVESHKRRLEDAIKFADMTIEMLKENNYESIK